MNNPFLSFPILSREEEYDRLQNLFVRQTIPTIPTIVSAVDIAGNNVQEQIHQQLRDFEEKRDEMIRTIHCEICGGKYSHFNKNRHVATKKHKSAMLSLPLSLQLPPSPLSLPLTSLPLTLPLLEREQSVEGTSP